MQYLGNECVVFVWDPCKSEFFCNLRDSKLSIAWAIFGTRLVKVSSHQESLDWCHAMVYSENFFCNFLLKSINPAEKPCASMLGSCMFHVKPMHGPCTSSCCFGLHGIASFVSKTPLQTSRDLIFCMDISIEHKSKIWVEKRVNWTFHFRILKSCFPTMWNAKTGQGLIFLVF